MWPNPQFPVCTVSIFEEETRFQMTNAQLSYTVAKLDSIVWEKVIYWL